MADTSKSISARTRLATLFDDGDFVEIDAVAGNDGGAKAGYGSVGGATVFAFSQGASESGDSLDSSSVRKLEKVYDLATKTGAPIVTIYDSLGVNVENGFESLESSSRLLKKMSEISGVVPQIAVVVGTCGGFYSMAAAMADVCVMSKKAELFLTPGFVDKAKGGEEENVGSAEFAEKAGVAAVIKDTETLAIAAASDIVKFFPLNNLAALPIFEFEAPATGEASIETLADKDSSVELFGGIGKHSRTVIATVGGMPCGIIETSGRLCRKDTGKSAKLVEVCDAFNIPVLTLVDSEGFKQSAENDRLGGILGAAKLAHVVAEATTVKVAVIKGRAIGSVYTVFCGRNAGCDVAIACEDAVISALEPAAAVNVLWNDRITTPDDIETLAAEYAKTEASAEKAAKAGLVDAVVSKNNVRSSVIATLDMLASKRVSRLPKKHGNLPF